MEKIKTIFKNCNDSLIVLNKKIKKAMTEYQDSLESPSKSDIKKMTNIQNAYAELQSDCKEMKASAKLVTTLIKHFMSHGEGLDEIEEAQKEYNRTKTNAYMQIGFVSKALEAQTNVDFESEIDKFMQACDELPTINSIIQSTEVLGGIDEIDFEDPTFLVGADEPTLGTPSQVQENVTVKDGDTTDEESSNVEKPDLTLDLNSKPDLKMDVKNGAGDTNQWDQEIKSGGLNKESDQYVTVGGNDVIVGERAKYCIRQKILQLKQAADMDEQLEVFGVKDPSELSKKCKEIVEDPTSYVDELVQEYKLDELLQQALVDLKNRVKTSFKKYTKSGIQLNLESKFEKLIEQIETAQGDLMKWTKISFQPKLYKIAECLNALQQKTVVLKCKSAKSLEKLLEQTKEELKTLEKAKQPEKMKNPGEWTDEFTITQADVDDPIRCMAKIEKNLAPQLTELELYYACASEYIDQQWPGVKDEESTLIDLKYRIYLMGLVNNSPIADEVAKLTKKYKVGNYTDFKNFVNSV